MYYKIKVSNPNEKGIITYLTDAEHFAEAAYKITKIATQDSEVEEIKLMKNFKPAINEKFDQKNKLYMVKVAEDIEIDGKVKTIKYELPAFANDSISLYDIVNDYLKQGFDNMRLTTISETKWIYVE